MFTMLRHDQRRWLLPDLIAGLTLTAFLVPTGMGYATASGLPVAHGLYASIAALVAYFVCGPSRILVLGPDSALAPLVAAAVAAGPVAEAPARAAVLAILSGLLCLLAAVLRLGILTDLISKPVRIGYLNGIAITVIIGQLPTLLGMTPPDGLPRGPSFAGDVMAVADGVWHHRIDTASVALGGGCLAVILLLRMLSPRVPGVLIAVVGAAAAVAAMRAFGLATPAMVAKVPPGLPGLVLPAFDGAMIVAAAPVAAAIALVAAADTSVLSRAFPGPDGVPSPPNRELAALGCANLAAGILQGFPVSSSSTRTPVVAAAGGRTQLAGLVAAGGVAAVISWAPDAVSTIPKAALAAVVIAACGSLIDVAGVLALARIRPGECAVSTVCLAGVVAFGVLPGILLAVAVALADFIWRSWRPHDAVLGRVVGIKGYHDVARHPDARQVPGLVMFRWDSPLFFANAGMFRRRLLDVVAQSSTPTKRVIIAAEPMTDIDTTAAETLTQLTEELRARGIELGFAELKGPVKDRLRRYGIYDTLGAASFALTLGRAVASYVKAYEIPWTD